eukprot:scaffold13708_cov116-Isochrysis_galbana.AAC.5
MPPPAPRPLGCCSPCMTSESRRSWQHCVRPAAERAARGESPRRVRAVASATVRLGRSSDSVSATPAASPVPPSRMASSPAASLPSTPPPTRHSPAAPPLAPVEASPPAAPVASRCTQLRPSTSAAATAAPRSIRKSTTRACAAAHASISGVHRLTLTASMGAPRSSSAWTTAVCPAEAAACRAVQPCSSAASIRVPHRLVSTPGRSPCLANWRRWRVRTAAR